MFDFWRCTSLPPQGGCIVLAGEEWPPIMDLSHYYYLLCLRNIFSRGIFDI